MQQAEFLLVVTVSAKQKDMVLHLRVFFFRLICPWSLHVLSLHILKLTTPPCTDLWISCSQLPPVFYFHPQKCCLRFKLMFSTFRGVLLSLLLYPLPHYFSLSSHMLLSSLSRVKKVDMGSRVSTLSPP